MASKTVDNPKERINTVKRTAQVLKLLSERSYRFTDIARKLHLTKSTAHRLVQSCRAN